MYQLLNFLHFPSVTFLEKNLGKNLGKIFGKIFPSESGSRDLIKLLYKTLHQTGKTLSRMEGGIPCIIVADTKVLTPPWIRSVVESKQWLD